LAERPPRDANWEAKPRGAPGARDKEDFWKVNWTCVRAPLETDAVAKVTGVQDLRLPLSGE